MKKPIPLSILSLAAMVLLSLSVSAQERTEVTVQVKKDGKVVKDTNYQFEDHDSFDIFIDDDSKEVEAEVEV